MYNNYFGFRENPFSIAPDPRYLYLSEMHRDALAHLQFGVSSEGGIILLTGEVGTGKTTLCRYFLEQLEPTAHVALIINPGLSASELLATVCDEFRIPVDRDAGTKKHIDVLNQFLLTAHGNNRETLLIIDEAQNLDKEALEMVRLLTNLETDRSKLLKIFLLGQSELATVLKSPDLTQFSQRITGRFHLTGLEDTETMDYIQHRISVAGGSDETLFNEKAVKKIHRLTNGIPRLINTLCDRCLLGAYSDDRQQVDETIVKKAAREIFGFDRVTKTIQIPVHSLATVVVVLIMILGLWVGTTSDLFHLRLDSILASSPSPTDPETTETVVEQVEAPPEIIEPAVAEGGAQIQLSYPEPESKQIEPPPPAVAEDETVAETPPVELQAAAEPAAVDSAAADDEIALQNIFIAPMQISSARLDTPETKIVIKHIEINE